MQITKVQEFMAFICICVNINSEFSKKTAGYWQLLEIWCQIVPLIL